MADLVASRVPPPRRHRALRPRFSAPTSRLRFWQLFWAPFWLGSEVPLFAPTHQARLGQEFGPAGSMVVQGVDQIANRLWVRHALHLLARAVWLTLAFGCLWLLLDLAGGPAFQWQGLLWVGPPLAVLALIFAILNRPGRYQTARMLDRSFILHDRLTTTLDHLGQGVPGDGERASIVYLQMADAANVITEARQHRALRIGPPIRELVPGLGFALVLAALFFLRGTGDGIPDLAAASVPEFTPAVARQPVPDQTALSPENTELAPTVDEVMERSRRSNAAQQDLQQLAAALSDQATTKPAADAITQGEYDAAASALREFAPQADQLSPAAREALARDLNQAASRMSPENGDLRAATDEAAVGLRQGGEPARASVAELGDAVERTGANVASQQELADQMQRAQESQGSQQSERGPGQNEPSDSSSQAQSSEPGGAGDQSEAGEAAAGGEPGADQAGQSPSGQEVPADAGESGSGEPGDGAAEAGAGQGGEPGEAGEAQRIAAEAQAGEGAEAGQGPGAAGGDSDADAPMAEQGQGQGSGGADSAPVPGEAEQRVTDASGDRVQAENPGDGRATALLPAAPTGEGVQTVNNAGGMVRGSGAGITAGAGSAVQTAIDQAGPDSNHVPEVYRPVVERYFSDRDDE